MEIKPTLLILLLLSLVNIAGVLLLLYRSSDWSRSIAPSIKQPQDQDEGLNNDGEQQYLEQTTSNSLEASAQRPLKQSSGKIRIQTSEIKHKLSPRPVLVHEVWLNTPSKQDGYFSTHTKSHNADVVVTIDRRRHTINISKDFSFPHIKCVLRDTKLIAKTPWVRDLARVAIKSHVKTIFAVTVSNGYKESLLNWLVSAVLGEARVPLDQVLVIAMDRPTHVDLEKHGIVSVHVPPSSLFGESSGISNYDLIMYTRISVVRLLNHWGISVMMFDTDALIMRDPLPLFNEHPSSSIVTSKGKQPADLYEVWKTTICNGVLLIRSNNDTELFWKKAGEIQFKRESKISDQRLLNYALYYMKIEWQRQGHSDDPYIEGTCGVNGMRVTIIPLSKICRRNCHSEKPDRVYVWHPAAFQTGETKMKSASEYGLNFLSPHWSKMDCHSHAVGEQWLQCISDGRFHLR